MDTPGKVLIVNIGADTHAAGELRLILDAASGQGCRIAHELLAVPSKSMTITDLRRVVAQTRPDIIFFVAKSCSLRRVRAFAEGLQRSPSRIPTMVGLNGSEAGDAFDLLNRGAVDFVTAPFRAADILPRIWRLVSARAPDPAPPSPVAPPAPPVAQMQHAALGKFVGQCECFQAELRKLPLVARCDSGVLICGETGTGKELFARSVHELSPRAAGPFVPLNCAAIPLELAESELFGHERGAFTGAHAARRGVIAQADGGTLFLDEINCLPLLAQAKLLRFLQEKEIRPIGGENAQPVNVRVVAATNESLEDAAAAGRFRRDLLYRLNVVPIELPPLRQRRSDVLLLASHFLAQSLARIGGAARQFSAEAIACLHDYAWPGNVRELEHKVERAVILSLGTEIGAADLGFGSVPPPSTSLREQKASVVAQFERSQIENLLATHGGNISQAASAAGKNRRAFWELLRKYGISAELFRPLSNAG